jgi:hypothetical protein
MSTTCCFPVIKKASSIEEATVMQLYDISEFDPPQKVTVRASTHPYSRFKQREITGAEIACNMDIYSRCNPQPDYICYSIMPGVRVEYTAIDVNI